MGDTFTGKVVKTTQFGAFVELKKGTDGLLHVSNVGPGRVAHIEDVMARGDTVDVLVQEVDKARGRIGLKLVPSTRTASWLRRRTLVERAKSAPPRRAAARRRRRGRGGRDRGPRRDHTRRGRRHLPPSPYGQCSRGARAADLTTLPSGGRVVTEHVPGVRSVALGVWIGPARGTSRVAGRGVSLHRAPALQGHRATARRRSRRSSTGLGGELQRRDFAGDDAGLRARPRATGPRWRST